MSDQMNGDIPGKEYVFCRTCGAKILKEAEVCPKCGVRQIPVSDYASFEKHTVNAEQDHHAGPNDSPKSRMLAALLCFFVGVIGVHRFYVGRVGSGIAMIFFGWLTLGIWPLIDLIFILCGNFKDGDGKLITNWDM